MALSEHERENYGREMTAGERKYQSAHAWFMEYASGLAKGEPSKLHALCISLANQISADEIEDLFGDEMAADGYYDE
jgi:hypothetical protein